MVEITELNNVLWWIIIMILQCSSFISAVMLTEIYLKCQFAGWRSLVCSNRHFLACQDSSCMLRKLSKGTKPWQQKAHDFFLWWKKNWWPGWMASNKRRLKRNGCNKLCNRISTENTSESSRKFVADFMTRFTESATLHQSHKSEEWNARSWSIAELFNNRFGYSSLEIHLRPHVRR